MYHLLSQKHLALLSYFGNFALERINNRPSSLMSDISLIENTNTNQGDLLTRFLKKIDTKVDIYGFGLILLYIMTGKAFSILSYLR